jgi:hypothetical protein
MTLGKEKIKKASVHIGCRTCFQTDYRSFWRQTALGYGVKIFIFQDTVSNILSRTFTQMFEHSSSIHRRLQFIGLGIGSRTDIL